MTVPDHAPHLEIQDPDAEQKLAERDMRMPLDEMPTGTFTSSNVHSALYDFGERTLFLRFKRDGPDAIYRYDDVDASTWQGLKAAASKGSYVNSQIAWDYQYTKLTTSNLPNGGRDVGNDLLRRFLTTP